ncbi:nucleoid-associated protein [Rhizobium laguerreae]|uniref:nucleoid-associated protein n=1 Tax=Rhizobium laguerreae TaxID=1076926 RepID=UPI001C91AC5B|nr:nucleoid-associated protein [Rhizobium laguerreae]MBY3268421.1 nucleoid-associated protein [Rhizobium laguerreae]
MGLLDDASLGSLRIERMIFHVVGPNEEDLVLMDEVDVRSVGDFFLDRIKETNIGNRFNFIGPHQGVRPSLASIWKDQNSFVEVSKQLAESFQAQHETVASKKGAFIVALLSGLQQRVFALIKFDDLRVLRFRSEVGQDGRVKAIVSEIDNTFQEDRKAMQKSALIVLTEESGDVAVFDRTNRQNITDYFRAFLGVKRLYTPEQATTRLKKALTAAFTKHQTEASDDVRLSWRERLFNATRQRDAVEPEEDFEVFGASVFGEFWKSVEFRQSVAKELDREKISGEAIVLDRKLFTKPTLRRLKTLENVVLRYPEDLNGVVVKIEKHKDGSAQIIINTERIVDNDLMDGPAQA